MTYRLEHNTLTDEYRVTRSVGRRWLTVPRSTGTQEFAQAALDVWQPPVVLTPGPQIPIPNGPSPADIDAAWVPFDGQ